jgi:hypothetical protein
MKAMIPGTFYTNIFWNIKERFSENILMLDNLQSCKLCHIQQKEAKNEYKQN